MTLSPSIGLEPARASRARRVVALLLLLCLVPTLAGLARLVGLAWRNPVGLTVSMASGWLVNLAVVEWLLRRTGAVKASEQMKAVLQDAYGAPDSVLRYGDADKPSPGPDEVLVRVRAASVNTPDWSAVIGEPRLLTMFYGLSRPRSAVRGTDLAGVVEAVGARVEDLAVGDAVFGSTGGTPLSCGTFAQYAVAPADRLAKKPDAVSFVDAAAAVMSGITALVGIRDVAAVSEGQRVLINGASGGVGTYAIQLAKLRGAHVTAVCSEPNHPLVRRLGADAVIDYRNTDFTEGESRFDVVLDNVLNHPPRAAAKVLSEGGLLIPNSIGEGSRWTLGVPRMLGGMLMKLGRTRVGLIDCAVTRSNLCALADLLASGKLESVIDRVYSLEETPKAVARMASHRARGNIVVRAG